MKKLIFRGIVQGVGFRPTVYRIAEKLDANGYVLNKGSEVEVVIDVDPDKFIFLLKKELPSIAKITEIIIEDYNGKIKGFSIYKSIEGSRQSLIPVDTATCENCIKEIFDKKNRRYLYPFTNCTICGARFSIISDIPYDRERTAMDSFPLCKECQREYRNPLDRRYHAQTISCPTCGPKYTLYDNHSRNLGSKNAIKKFAEIIDNGGIGVVKSWGGMHICCKLEEISRFREWYHRPQKSFAVMVRNLDVAREYGEVNEQIEELLISPQRPIVLVKKKKAEEVSPGLDTIGLYLPYTALHHILFHYLKTDALIMTSANIPGEPMIIDNKEVFSLKADVYLLHNREIINRIDDSVIKPWDNKIFFLRKSRGYVPEPIPIDYNHRILTVGASEQVHASISTDSKIYMTQYIGNTQYYPTLQFLEDSLRHMMHLTMDKKTLDAVGIDKHPRYTTRDIAYKFAEEYSTPIFEIQHHWAHAASLLLDQKIEEAIVLTLDGLGYGDDGNLWGGEILLSSFKDYNRIGHLEYIPLLGGDKATEEPYRIVYALLREDPWGLFSDFELKLLERQYNISPKTSSLGRILDAISCYLGICMKRTYEGEPAMKLEKYLAQGKPLYEFNISIKNNIIETKDLFKQLREIAQPPFTDKIKADLSYSLIKTIIDAMCNIAIEKAEKEDIPYIGVTGGVSYNIPIIEMIKKNVEKNNLKLLVHNHIPNGDGGIAVGQNVIISRKLG